MLRRAALALVLLAPLAAAADDPSRALPPGQKPADGRLGKPKDLNGYFPFTPPTSREAWDTRRQLVREQILVATGLWPLPEKTPLNPVVHGKIERDGYTIEKVFFASLPGHYVSGNLYRPASRGREAPEKRPGVLFAHGHWANGRLHDDGEKAARASVAAGAEGTLESGRFFLQALPAQLARTGCVVFHYDMVGVADSKAIPHAAGFADADAELRLQSAMGLQTWNSVRALDFLTGLPDVDPARIGMTGASGGGTQTFILAAIDDRVKVAFPAVMVSTGMQGGCVCENCSHLRVGTGNVEFAGLFAPKPLGMSAANDWTREIETKGLPELQALYRLLGADGNVMARCYPQFGHNYNQVSRELMYDWFNDHLKLGQPKPVKERPFVPVPPKELSVYDAEHPRAKDETDAAGVRRYLTEASERQMAALAPKDAAGLGEFRRVVGTALRVMVHDTLPTADEIEAKEGPREDNDGVISRRLLLGRKGQGEQVPAVGLCRSDFDGTVVIWAHPAGKASLYKDGKLTETARAILDRKAAILAVDVFGTGELAAGKPAVDGKYAGYTYGYNRSLLANRVHDLLTAVAYARGHEQTRRIDLVGWESAGSWVLAARALCGDAVARTAVDMDQFLFDRVKATDDPMMLPGAVKYGGQGAFLALCAPGEVLAHNHRGTASGKMSKAAYQAAGAEAKLERPAEKWEPAKVVEWLLR
jgi:dienelactone hydrolase